MAEDKSIGISRLLQPVGVGTNDVQSAADSVTVKFNQLAQAATSVTAAFQTVGGGRTGSGSSGNSSGFFASSWNSTSNRNRYSSNGGGGAFSGTPFGYSGGRGYAGGNGGGGSFPGSPSRGNRIATTLSAGAGIASAFNSYATKNMNSMMQMNYFGTSSASIGGGTAGINTAERLAFSNNYAALSVNDAAQAGYTNAYTFGNPVFNGQANPAFVTGQSQANAFGYVSPTMGATAAAQAAQQTYAPRSFYAAQGLGIASPLLPGGVKNSMSNIAQSIFTRTFGNQKINNAQFNAATAQGGSLSANLAYMGQQMGWSQATQQEYQNYLGGMVTAQSKGISQSSYATLTQQAAAGGKGAQAQLKSLGIGNSAFEAQRDLTSTQTTRSEDVNETMATAFTTTTNVVNQFSSALTSLMKATGLDKLLGLGGGITAPVSNALGGFSSAFGAGAGLMGAARLFGGSGGLLGGLGSMFGGGGAAASAGSSTINATMGANGVYNITSLAGGGSLAGTLAGVGTVAAPIVAGTALFAAGADWLSNTALANQYGVPIPAGYNQNDFNAYEKIKLKMMSGYRGTWPRMAAQWETAYFKANPPGTGGKNDNIPMGGRSGGGSTSVVGNSLGNGASNLGASSAQVIKAAETQLGVPYSWGGENPGKGMDCSGLTQWAYAQAGVKIPRVAADQQKAGKPVATNATQPGDLLFMGNPAHHVVMSIGGGKIIEAPHTGAKVRIRSFSPSEFTNAGRFVGNIGNTSSLLNGNSSSTATLNDLMGMAGGDLGSFIGGTSELDAITSALSGGLGAGSVPLSASSGSAAGTSGGTGTAPAGNASNSSSALQGYAKKLLSQYGWSGEWGAFNNIVMAESGWNYKARNAQSGAYGIPQALPGSKMASAGSDWQSDGDTQLRWMMSYIKGRYGDPSNAWSFHQKNNWYAAGAWNIDQDQAAQVHKGEMILPAKQAETVRNAINNAIATSSGRPVGSSSSITFGNIYVQLPQGYSGTQQEASSMAKTIVAAVEDNLRLKNLQAGQ